METLIWTKTASTVSARIFVSPTPLLSTLTRTVPERYDGAGSSSSALPPAPNSNPRPPTPEAPSRDPSGRPAPPSHAPRPPPGLGRGGPPGRPSAPLPNLPRSNSTSANGYGSAGLPQPQRGGSYSGGGVRGRGRGPSRGGSNPSIQQLMQQRRVQSPHGSAQPAPPSRNTSVAEVSKSAGVDRTTSPDPAGQRKAPPPRPPPMSNIPVSPRASQALSSSSPTTLSPRSGAPAPPNRAGTSGRISKGLTFRNGDWYRTYYLHTDMRLLRYSIAVSKLCCLRIGIGTMARLLTVI